MKIITIIIVISLLIMCFGIFIVIKYSKKKKGLSDEKKKFLLNNFKRIGADIDNKHRIINYDKLYHKILMEIGYEGTFGDILKMKPDEIMNLNKIWELHKLRNKLVHDFDLLEEIILNRKAREYKAEIEKLLKKI